MSASLIYMAAGAVLAGLALYRLATSRDLFLRILGLNVLSVAMGAILLSAARGALVTDAVPQAFVLTGIVVLVAVTAALLAMAESLEGGGDD
ncbi:MAG: NADH-quinone oxidoreductase subunit K [Pseudomonadota bacterium]